MVTVNGLLHSLLFILGPDYLAVSAAVESPSENPLRLNDCTLGDIVLCSIHDLDQLGGCCLVVCSHLLLDDDQDVGH